MNLRRALVAAVALLGCAQYGAPPGGERDQQPPQVIATVPEPLSVVPGLTDAVVIRFDERLSERGAEEAVIVSPRTGEVDVERSGSELRVRLEGGWRPNQVYRIVILPELRDLFGNQRTEPAELVFSTGPAIPETALAGIVTERITGRPPQRAVVEAVRQTDSTVYVTPVATDGFYALLNLPNGEYEVMAYADANQDWTPGPTESRSRARTITLADDTTAIDLALLPFDTTAARVTNVAMQNEAVRIQLDDHVDSTGIAGASVLLYTLPDTTLLPLTFTLSMTSPQGTRPDTTPADSIADELAPDSLRVPADTSSVEVQAPDTTAAQQGAPTASLPVREFFAVPATRPAAGEYLVEVRGVTNINGYPDGGGMAPLTVPPPDTTSAAPDTTRARPDTVSTIPDSAIVRLPADSLVVPPDTLPVLPDTVPVTPDTIPLPTDTVPPPRRSRR